MGSVLGKAKATPLYDQSAAQREQTWAANQARKYGNVGVNSALGGYNWMTNPDGTQSVNVNLSEADQARQGLVNNALGSLNMTPIDTSGIQNFNFDGTQAANNAYNMSTRYLNQDFARQNQDLQTQLANRGIPVGSMAYDRAVQTQSDSQNRALAQAADQAVFSGQQYNTNQFNNLLDQASGLSNLQGGQISNIGALGSQIYNPLSSMVQGTGGQFGGTYDNYYQSQVQRNNDKNAQKAGLSNTLGQMAGMAATVAPYAIAAFSDKRLKENIVFLDKVGNTNIYLFDYIKGDKQQVGVIAQEIKDTFPKAVIEEDDGFYKVDYKLLPYPILERINQLKEEYK